MIKHASVAMMLSDKEERKTSEYIKTFFKFDKLKFPSMSLNAKIKIKLTGAIINMVLQTKYGDKTILFFTFCSPLF